MFPSPVCQDQQEAKAPSISTKGQCKRKIIAISTGCVRKVVRDEHMAVIQILSNLKNVDCPGNEVKEQAETKTFLLDLLKRLCV